MVNNIFLSINFNNLGLGAQTNRRIETVLLFFGWEIRKLILDDALLSKYLIIYWRTLKTQLLDSSFIL